MPIPLKEKVKNYDNLLTGRLINFVENPDSLGYADGRWYSPKYDRRYKSGAFDPANFGIGIDRNSNEYVDNGELMFHKDSKGREYLTEAEERNVRNHSIANAEKSYAKRLSHAQETLHSNNIPSEIKKAITISAIYNLGQGYVANNLFEDNVLMDAFLNGSDLEYSNQVNRYYEKKRKGDRGIKTNKFIEQLQQEPVTMPNTTQGGGIRAEGGSLNSHKLWDDLSMTERAEMMRVAVNNGITDLPTIRQKYNEFAEGGPKRDYNTWKNLIHDYKGIDVDNDNTYDYLSYYNNHTDEAWDMLNNAPDAHFYDTYKTAYHPTFSDESVYSGRYDLLHNSRGIVGGRWLENPNRFIPSPSKRDVDSIRETTDYISIAEPNGLQIRDEHGRWPIVDGIVFGGVLPQVDVSPNLYPDGGPIGHFIKVPDDIASRVSNLYNYAKTYLKTKLSGTGDGTFIDLSNQNVSRIKDNTKGVKSILTNEFVEHNNNTVRKKKDFINTNDTLLGDRNIPLSNISTFYGIEDGKLKAGPLSTFDDETLVVPNRTKSTPKLKKVIIPSVGAIKNQSELADSIINAYNASKGYKQSTFYDIVNTIFPWTNPLSPRRILYDNEGRDAVTRVLNENPIKVDYFRKAITEQGDTILLPFINASPKVLFADETGNAAFVSNLGNPDNVTKLNAFLDKNPSYPVMVDNGRYSSYMTTLPNASIYTGLNSPDNMFIVGTVDTNKHSNGGKIHIKPENRGKFTALKERTGHSATWFKQHGTPAQRKMATFALNSRKWKHPDGGPLVVNDIPDDYTYYVGSLPAVTVSAPALPAYQDQFTGQWYGIGPGGRKVNKPVGFNPSGARVYTSPEAFERARLNRAYADDLNHFGEFGDMVRKGATALTLAPMAGPLVEAATTIAPTFAPGSAFWTNPITKQFIASTIGGELANAGSKLLTGKTLDERNAASFEYLTGKKPEDVWYGNLVTGALNPGYLLSPNPLMSEIGDMVSTATNIAKIASPKYRSLHAYNTINPKGYENPLVRGEAWLRDMIEDNPVDLKRPLFYQKAIAENNGIRPEEGFLGTGDYLPRSVTNRGQISDEARLDAWAIHNNLEPQYGTYIKTGDRTYSYNIPKLMEESNGTLQAPGLPKKDKIGGQGVIDFVTGAGGGLTDFTLLGEDAHGNALIRIGDLWDVNPFKRIGDELSHRLFPKWDGSKLFTKGSRLYDLGEERSSNILKYIGDKMMENSDEPLLGILKPLDRKLKDFEVGTITGGKPFMMSTEIPVHKKYSPYTFTIDGSEMKGSLLSYPFGYNPDYFVDKTAIREYDNFKFDPNKVINYKVK